MGPDLGCGSPGDAPVLTAEASSPQRQPRQCQLTLARPPPTPPCAGLQFQDDSRVACSMSQLCCSSGAHRYEEGLSGDALRAWERGVQWYSDASVPGRISMNDSDKGSWSLIRLVDDMKVGRIVIQLEDSEGLPISRQEGALFIPPRRNQQLH